MIRIRAFGRRPLAISTILLLTDRKPADKSSAASDRQPDICRNRPRQSHGGSAYHRSCPGSAARGKKIFGADIEIVGQVQLLMNQRDAKPRAARTESKARPAGHRADLSRHRPTGRRPESSSACSCRRRSRRSSPALRRGKTRRTHNADVGPARRESACQCLANYQAAAGRCRLRSWISGSSAVTSFPANSAGSACRSNSSITPLARAPGR